LLETTDRIERDAIELAAELAVRHGIRSIAPLLESCRVAIDERVLSIAVLGRFKAGKSSFLNHLVGRSIFPVGVIPVTAVVTSVEYEPRARAVVRFLDGRLEEVAPEAIGSFVAESGNPDNVKGVSTVTVELPELERLRDLRFVDTPGLENAHVHNTEAALEWLPNAALALVATSADHPLSEQDLELLERVGRFTPKVSVLLTKADLLDKAELAEVLGFVRGRLAEVFDTPPEVFPYSVRPGFDRFKARVEETLVEGALAGFDEQRGAILHRKVETLLEECRDYL
jgi:GTP-binding protein EngB required for normal cell division